MSVITEMKFSKASRFHALAWPHAETVLQAARYLTRDDSDAEDLAQETLLKAYRRIECLRDDARAKPWLKTILRNTHVDRARVSRRSELSLDELELDPPAAECHGGNGCGSPRCREAVLENPEIIMQDFEDADVLGALRKLPKDIRWTLLLVDVEGLLEAEAAAALRIPVGTVKSRLHRGRNMLRGALHGVAVERRLAS
jgi:RNA polymerase sigma-70 factor (ECF subfamily)